jgi:orotate phosphoribosyltransferase
MKSVDGLMKKAMELKKSGLTAREIATDLHLSPETVTWLLTRRVKDKEAPLDVKIGWRSVGVYGRRMEATSMIFADIIEEEAKNGGYEVDTVVGIALNGIPYASYLSTIMDSEFGIYRPPSDENGKGAFSSNYAGIENKNVVIVDDVVGTGHTINKAITALQEGNANPVLVMVMINKTAKNDLMGVPLRALIRSRIIN